MVIKELDNQFMPTMDVSPRDTLEFKNILYAACLRETNFTEVGLWNMHKIYNEIEQAFDGYVSILMQKYKNVIKLELETEGEIYIDDSHYNNALGYWESEDSIKDYFLYNIFLYSVIPHDSPFGDVAGSKAKSEKYINKLEELSEYIEDLAIAVDEMMEYKLKSFYDEKEGSEENEN